MKVYLVLLALISAPSLANAEPVHLACQFPPMTGVPNPPSGAFAVTLDEAAGTMSYTTPAGAVIKMAKVMVDGDTVIVTNSETRGKAGIVQTEEWRIGRSSGQVIRTFTLGAPKLGIFESPETFKGVCSART